MYRDATNVEPEMYDCTSNNWSHWNNNESLKKNLEAVPGKHSIDSLQKTAILGTSHIIRKVLYGLMRKNLATTGIRSPGRPTRSESLHRLRSPGSFLTTVPCRNPKSVHPKKRCFFWRTLWATAEQNGM